MPKIIPHDQSAESLRNIAVDLQEISSEISATADFLSDKEIPLLDNVPNYRSLLEGLDKLTTFANGVKRRIRFERHDRGDFGASPPEVLQKQGKGAIRGVKGDKKPPPKKSSKRGKADT